MTDVPVATVSRAESPDSPGNSPSPPAVVPNSEKITRNQSKQPLTREQRRNEEFAFAKFLSIEEQRLRKSFPQLPYRDIEKRLVAGWMKMRPAQRLKFLDSENSGGMKEKNVDDGKASLKRKLDEQFDCRLKLPSLKTATTGGGGGGIVEVPGLLAKPASQKQPKPTATSGQQQIIEVVPLRSQAHNPLSSVSQALGLENSFERREDLATPTKKIIMEGRVGKILLTRGNALPSGQTMENNKSVDGNVVFVAPSTPVSHHYPSSRVLHHSPAKEALDNYYLALCAPAFPHPDEEPLTPHSANYYLECYQRLSRY